MSASYSHSRLQAYKACPLSCFFKYEVGLEKDEDEKSEHHLVYGRAIHEALKLLYLGDTLEASKKKFLEVYPKNLDEEDKAKTVEHGPIILERYAEKWKHEDKRWRVVACEEKDGFQYAEEESFTVVLDLVWENIEHGGIYGVDHKVVGGKKATLSYDFWNQFEPNSQVTKYASYIRQKYGDCSGFYINAIGCGYRSRAYKGEPAGFWTRFERQMFNRNASQMEREEADTEEWIRRIEDSRARGAWPMNTDACRFCQYRPICSAGWTWEHDQELITIQYNVKKRKDVQDARS